MTALEPDADVAAIARRNCVDLDATVELTSFEDWAAPPGRAFEQLFAEVGHAIDDAGGTFPMSYVTELFVARRAG
jgi:hypothetical protein